MSGPLFGYLHDAVHDHPASARSRGAVSRRRFLAGTGAIATFGAIHSRSTVAQALASKLPSGLPEGTRTAAVLDALPGKRPLIKLSYRPPNYETPIEYFPMRSRRTMHSLFAIICRPFRKLTAQPGRSQ